MLAAPLAVAACGDSDGPGFNPDLLDAGSSPPEILRFEASNAVVDEAQTVFLGWETTNAETVTLRAEPGDPLLVDSLRVNSVAESRPLVVPTRFELVAVGPDGTTRASVEVDVRPPDEDEPPRIIELFVTPEVYQGLSTEARLSWTATGELALTRNGEPVQGFTGEPFGSLEETVTESQIVYRLTATRAGETVVATGTITRSEVELEPNDRPEDASVPSGDLARGRIDSNNRDLWVVQVPELGRVTAFVDDGAQGCPFDSVLELFRYDPEAPRSERLAFVTSNDDASPTDLCSRIDPLVDPRASSLSAGLYIVRLSGATEDDRGQYRLTIRVEPQACGNGTVEFGAGEACDDGNTDGGDGCSSTCAIEALLDLVGPGSSEGPTPALAAGERRWAVVELGSAGSVAAQLDASSCEAGALQLRDAEVLEGTEYRLLGTSNERCELPARAVGAGRYLVQLDGGDEGRDPASISVQAAPAGCGDQILQGTELCDDGNAIAGDGCAPDCTFELAEDVTEPIVDYTTDLPEDGYQAFRISTVEGSIRIRPTFEGSCPTPTRVALRDRYGRLLGMVEDESACAKVDPQVHDFAADVRGEFYVTIESLSGAAQPKYEIRFTEPSCGNGVVERDTGDERCDDGSPSENCDRFCELRVDDLLFNQDFEGPIPIECPPGPGVPSYRFDIDPADEVERVGIVFAAPTLSAAFSVATGDAPFLNEQLEIRVLDGNLQLVDLDVGEPNQIPTVARVPFVVREDPTEIPDEPIFVEIRRINAAGPILNVLRLDVPCFNPGRCGDGFIEQGEQCDDGNEIDGDGCNRLCDFEIPNTRELEGVDGNRNDARVGASPLDAAFGVPSRPVIGQLFPPGDVDFYRLEIPAGETYSLRAFISGDPSDPTACSPEVQGPIRLALLDDEERVLAESDPLVGCASLDAARTEQALLRDLPAGAYHLRVDRPEGGLSMSYSLFLALTP